MFKVTFILICSVVLPEFSGKGTVLAALDLPNATPIIALGLALLAWLLLALFLLWRNRKLTTELENQRELAAFFDSLLSSDRRFPIWIWASGQIQADQQALNLMQLQGNVDDLDDLAGDETCGLPVDAVERIRAGIAGAQSPQQPLVARYGDNRPPVLIDIQRLTPQSDDWPVSVLWFEESNVSAMHGASLGLRALEDRLADFSRIFDALPFPVWVRSENGMLVDVNASYVRNVEAEDASQVVKNRIELFRPEARTGARQALEDRAPVIERHNAVVGGTVHTFSVIHVPVAHGQVLGVGVDATTEIKAERELGRVLQAQSETLNLLRTPVAIFGPNQTLRYSNSAFARLTHLSEDVLASGIKHTELLDAMREKRRIPEQADYRAWRKAQLKQYTSVIKEPVEEIWYLPDGSAHRVVTQPHPQSGLLILFEDITDTLALEEKYNTLIAVQQETLDSMHEGVAVFSPGLRLQLANPAFRQMWQIDELRDINDEHVNDLLDTLNTVDHAAPPSGDRGFKDHLTSWLSERTTRDGRWHREDGKVYDYALVPLPDGGMMITQVDATDSFRVQQALRERSRALEVADRLKNQFITNMSYELRTPLNSIIGFAQLLEQQLFGNLNEIQTNYVTDILYAADELKSMISDVLDLAVIEAGEMTLDIRHVDMMGTLNEAALLAQEMARKANMTLKFEASEDVKSVMGDPRRLKQAFYNMVSAMLTLGRYGGFLTLTLESMGDDCQVKVTNPDCGMTQIDRDNLLASVEMGGMPPGRRATGLDLALVRSIVRLHGGQVRLEADGEDGVSLVCMLPRTQKPTRVISGKKAL